MIPCYFEAIVCGAYRVVKEVTCERMGKYVRRDCVTSMFTASQYQRCQISLFFEDSNRIFSTEGFHLDTTTEIHSFSQVRRPRLVVREGAGHCQSAVLRYAENRPPSAFVAQSGCPAALHHRQRGDRQTRTILRHYFRRSVSVSAGLMRMNFSSCMRCVM